MRKVHDVIFGQRTMRNSKGKVVTSRSSSPVAFIQHGSAQEDQGFFTYEIICPYCALTVGKVSEEEAGHEFTYAELHQAGHKILTPHMRLCTASGFKYEVEITKVNLNTERLVKES